MFFRGNLIQLRLLLATAILCLPSQHARAEAGEALAGAAAIIGAVSPMVVAGIQAGADTKMTAMEAASNVKTTGMKLAADEANNQRSALLSLLQTQAAERINWVNQQFAYATTYANNAAKVSLAYMEMDLRERESQRNHELELAKLEIDAKVAKEKRAIDKMLTHLDLVKAGLTTMASVTVDSSKGVPTGSLTVNPTSNRLLASLDAPSMASRSLRQSAPIVRGELAETMAANKRVRGSFGPLLASKGRSALSNFQDAARASGGEPTLHRAVRVANNPELRHVGGTASTPSRGLRVIGDEE